MWLYVLNKYSENHTISLFSHPQFGSDLKEMNLFFFFDCDNALNNFLNLNEFSHCSGSYCFVFDIIGFWSKQSQKLEIQRAERAVCQLGDNRLNKRQGLSQAWG